jgi:ubiquitin C-terminal hydrolase
MIINGNVLTLNQMIIHSGSSVSKGHYTVRFRCNDNWYLYDDMGPTVKEVGTFEKLISDQNEFIKKNCSILIYSDIDPTI